MKKRKFLVLSLAVLMTSFCAVQSVNSFKVKKVKADNLNSSGDSPISIGLTDCGCDRFSEVEQADITQSATGDYIKDKKNYFVPSYVSFYSGLGYFTEQDYKPKSLYSIDDNASFTQLSSVSSDYSYPKKYVFLYKKSNATIFEKRFNNEWLATQSGDKVTIGVSYGVLSKDNLKIAAGLSFKFTDFFKSSGNKQTSNSSQTAGSVGKASSNSKSASLGFGISGSLSVGTGENDVESSSITIQLTTDFDSSKTMNIVFECYEYLIYEYTPVQYSVPHIYISEVLNENDRGSTHIDILPDIYAKYDIKIYHYIDVKSVTYSLI